MFWNCICGFCGQECVKLGAELRAAEKQGKIVHCTTKCAHRSLAAECINKTFNQLLVVRINHELTDVKRVVMADTVCVCGKPRTEELTKVKLGKIKACSRSCKSLMDSRSLNIGKKIGLITIKSIRIADQDEKYYGDHVAEFDCDCGGKGFARTSYILAERVRSCGCLSEEYWSDFYGENNPNWRGGTSTEYQLARTSKEYRAWQRTVFARDQYRCQCCGYKSNATAKKLEAHHRLNFATHKELRFDPANGTTLCQGCHIAFHARYTNFNNTPDQLTEFFGDFSRGLIDNTAIRQQFADTDQQLHD